MLGFCQPNFNYIFPQNLSIFLPSLFSHAILPSRRSRTWEIAREAPGAGITLKFVLQNELPVFIDNYFLAVFEMGGNDAGGGRNHVRMHRGVVETQGLGRLFRKLGYIAGIGVTVGHAHCYMGIAVWPSHVLVEKSFSHEFSNARKSTVSQRKFSNPIRALRGNHFFEQLFISLGLGSDNPAVFKREFNIGYFIAVSVEGLIESNPAGSPAPVRGSE